jgi:ADP-heptose:LPS heptosyltransferase
MSGKFSPDRLAYKLALWWAAARKHPSRSDNHEPRTILVGATTFLGDLLMSAPLIAALRQRYPQAKLAVLVRPEYRGLAACIPGVDAVLEERHSWRWLHRQRRQQDGYDLAVAALESRILPLLAALGARTIVAYPDPKGRYRRLIDRPVAFPADRPQHLARLLLRLADAENAALSPPYLDTSKLPPFAGTPAVPFAVIHCGARSALRRWPPERYAIVAAACIEMGFQVVFSGAAGDGPAIASIKQDLPADQLLDLSGKTSLPQLAKLIERAALVIGPDTGVLHLAKALGRPSAVIIGQGQVEMFGPDSLYGPAAYFCIGDLSCRDKHTVHGQYAPWINTCSRNTCILPEPRCLLGIGASEVAAAVRRLLAARA